MNMHHDRSQGKVPRRQALIAGLLVMALAGPSLAQSRPIAKVWKDPSCGCCKDWVSHLQGAGFDVQVLDTGNTAARTRLGIPQKYGSCHTAQIGGYAIEGHVPASDIQRLLREAPQAIGLAAPGMDGPAYGGRKDAYDVLLIGKNGSSTVYQSHR
ncbi:DUF411 domain-containing protein [Pseudomonas aeruginosa]